MLGTSAEKIEYQTLSDFTSAADYLAYMFGGIQGISYRATINPTYFQSYYRTSGLINNAKFDGVYNAYVSMNTFYRDKEVKLDFQKGRDVEHLKRLNALYVDIDCYKIGLSKEQVLFALQDEYIQHKIPVPTFTVDSGRGIYLIWKLQNEDKNALPKWISVQQYLTDTLESLGADYACTDGARILRVPFSMNSKSRSMVTIREFNDVTYTLYEIQKEFDIPTTPKKAGSRKASKYPYNHATEKQRKYVKDIAERLGLDEADYPDFTNFHETDNWIKVHKEIDCPSKEYCYKNGNTYSLTEFKSIKAVFKSYCTEIRKLFSMRKGADCKREIALFLYRYFLREMRIDSETALKETLAFNADLSCPFEDSYVETVTNSADKRIAKGIPYAYKKSTIIKILEITDEELKKLPFLSTAVKEKAERKKEKNRRYYMKRLEKEGKNEKKDAIRERRASILAMRAEGKSAKEIRETLSISRATYQRDVAALSAEAVVTAATDAVKAVTEESKEYTAEAAKTVVQAVSAALDMCKTQTNNRKNVHVIVDAVKNRGKIWHDFLSSLMYQKFSPPFIDMNCVAVPHRGFANSRFILRVFLRVLHFFGGESEDSSSGDDAPPCVV